MICVFGAGGDRDRTKRGDMAAAEVWATATEAEANELRRNNGEWPEYEEWLKTPSGIATEKAKEASRKVGADPDSLMS